MNRYGEMARATGPVAAGTVRDDQRPGQLLLDLGRGNAAADRRAGRPARGRGQPGEDYLEPGGPGRLRPAARRRRSSCPGGPAGTGAEARRTRRNPAGRRRAGKRRWSSTRRPGVGGGERRAAGTGPGQLAARRFRPNSQDDLAPRAQSPASEPTSPRSPPSARSRPRADRRHARSRQPSPAGRGGAPPRRRSSPPARARLGARRDCRPAHSGGAICGGPQHLERPLH